MYILIIKSCFSLELCTLFRLNTSGSPEGSISPLKASRVMAVTSPSAERISRLSTSSGSNLKRFFSSSHFGANACYILQWLSAHLQSMKRLLFLPIRRLKFTYKVICCSTSQTLVAYRFKKQAKPKIYPAGLRVLLRLCHQKQYCIAQVGCFGFFHLSQFIDVLQVFPQVSIVLRSEY